MRTSTLLLALPATLSAAFVLPAGLFTDNFSEGDVAVDLSYSRVVRIACPGCPTTEPSDILLDFNLASSNPTEVTLNGVPVLSANGEASGMGVKAAMVPQNVDVLEYYVNQAAYNKVDLEYSILTVETVMLDHGPYKLDNLEFRIATVAGVPVKIEGVSIEIQEDLTNGHMLFGNIAAIPLSEMCGLDLKCLIGKMMEKVRGALPANPFSSFGQGCGGEMELDLGMDNYDFDFTDADFDFDFPAIESGSYYPTVTPTPVEPSFFETFITQILVPIFIGIMAGMAAGAAALIVVHAFVSVFRRARACRTRCSRRHQEQTVETDDVEADKSLLSTPPPAYVDEGLEVVEKE